MKVYITFGQSHAHAVNGKTFDKYCVAVIESKDYGDGRNQAFEAFGNKFCFAYGEEDWNESHMAYYPRGYITL